MKPEFIALAKSPESLPKPSLAEVAFVGRSNVGKSSLINTLVGQKIARSSSTPGRTQGLCFFKVSPRLIFVDFPGYGYAKVSKTERLNWGNLAEDYYRRRLTLRGTVWIYDLRRDPDELDHQMREWLATLGKPFLIALTKIDTLKRTEWTARKNFILKTQNLSENGPVPFSKTKEGERVLWRKVNEEFS
jgi:GTP-binding protein